MSTYAGHGLTINGNTGDDTITGTQSADVIYGGEGSDTIRGYFGADTIDLRMETTAATDTVVLKWGESTASDMDTIKGFKVDGVSGAANDRLDLPSNTIAANVTNADGTDSGTLKSHSIVGGIITFGDADGGGAHVIINEDNYGTALTYLSNNIGGPGHVGETVAFEGDTDKSGTVDSLIVFQDGRTDIVAMLNGVTGATLGTSAAAGVVELYDHTAHNPDSISFTTSADSDITIAYPENMFQNLAHTTHITIKVNGPGDDIMSDPLTGVSISGNVLTVNTNNVPLAQTDWLLLTQGDMLQDAAGNHTDADTVAAVGGSGDNTIIMTGAAHGVYIMGNGGNDTITGTAHGDFIYGGEGNDTIIGNGGGDYVWAGAGADTIDITHAPGVHATLYFENGDSVSSPTGFDTITGFNTTTAANNDTLDLPSLRISPDGTFDIADVTEQTIPGDPAVTIGKVVVHDGIATFTTDADVSVPINSVNAISAACHALGENILDGKTVAFDSTASGYGGTFVFQKYDAVSNADTLILLADVHAVASVDHHYADNSVMIA